MNLPDYLAVLGYRLEINEEYGVIQLTNPQNYNRLNLKLYESILLLILRVLYDEKRRELSESDEVIINVGEIHDKYLSLKIRDKMIDKTTLRNALSVFRRFQLIEILDKNLEDEDSRIIIFASILMAVRVEDIKAAYDKLEIYRKGKKNSSKIAKVMRRFGDAFAEKSEDDIFAEYNIYHTPNYVYFKGNVTLDMNGEVLQIGGLKQGIGISGDDVGKIQFVDMEDIEYVLTVENLTTFFRWHQGKTLLIYLGGYHNSLRRMLLKVIYDKLPNAQYLHFGDIDAGGFEIYHDLCARTGIPFECYRMDLATLQEFEEFGRMLTENDKSRLQKLLLRAEKSDGQKDNKSFAEVIRYMLEHNVKLEQECILI